MTKMEMALLFGNMGAGALSSAVGANQNKKNQAQQELDAMVQRQMSALQNKQQTSQSLQDQRQQGWKDQTSQSPLGQEQSYLQKQRLAQVLFPQIANFKPAMPTDAGVAGAYQAPTNFLSALNDPRLLDTFGDQATATSLADRRKLMAGLNPDYEFSSLGNFGLDSSFDQGVNRAQQDAAGRRSAYEQTQSDLANQQMTLASQPQQQQEEKKGGGVKGFLGGLLKTASPFAALIPGVGPLAAMGLAAGGSALGGALQGQGMGGVLGSAALGAGGALGAEALQRGGNPFGGSGPKLNNAMTSASLPVGAMSAPQASVGLPSKGFDMTQVIAGGLQGNNPAKQTGSGGARQAPAQSNMGQQPTGNVASGFSSQGYPLAAAGPYTGPGSTTGRISSIPNGSVAGLEFMSQLQQQPLVQALNSPVGAIAAGAVGASRPGVQPMGPMQGQLGAGPQFPQLGAGAQPKFVGSGATPQALAGGRQMPQLGAGPQMPRALPAGQYEMGPIGSTSMPQGSTFNLPKFSPSNMENQQNAMNIINQLSKMPKDQAAAFLATPQGQAVLQQLPRATSPYAGLSPQQMMQMVVRGGG